MGSALRGRSLCEKNHRHLWRGLALRESPRLTGRLLTLQTPLTLREKPPTPLESAHAARKTTDTSGERSRCEKNHRHLWRALTLREKPPTPLESAHSARGVGGFCRRVRALQRPM